MSHLKRTILVTLITVTAGVVIVITLVKARTNKHPEASTQSTVTPARVSNANRVEVVTVTLLPTGFEPNEIKREPGLFLLAVDNRTNLPEVNLHLVDESGNARHKQQFKGGKLDSRTPLNLPAGRYLLKVPNQKDWVCRIEIN